MILQQQIDNVMQMIEIEKFKLEFFDNILIRKLIDCIKVISKTKLLIIFKGGVNVNIDME